MTNTVFIDQAKEHRKRAVRLEQEKRYSKAAEANEKAAAAYENAAQFTRNLIFSDQYINYANRYRERANQLRNSKKVDRLQADGPESTDEFMEKVKTLIKKTSVKWSDISGLEETKKTIKEMVAMSIIPAENGVELPTPKGLLLYGPPGTGKTMLAAAAANTLQVTFFDVRIDQVLAKYVGDAPKMIEALFQVALERSPSLLFFDEIDAIAEDRESTTTVSTGLRNKLLVALSGLQETDELIMPFATTNRPWALDPALLDRFEELVYVPLPDFDAREGVFEINLNNRGYASEVSLEELAGMTEGYSGRGIANLCNRAIRLMLRRMNPSMAELAEKSEDEREGLTLKVAPISNSELQNALEFMKPTSTPEWLQRYEQWYQDRSKS